jgi:hypothetical protein
LHPILVLELLQNSSKVSSQLRSQLSKISQKKFATVRN